jgi:hypothetical protein
MRKPLLPHPFFFGSPVEAAAPTRGQLTPRDDPGVAGRRSP